MPGNQGDEPIKVGYMVKRSQGKSALGATNFKKRVFVLTSNRLSYYDGTIEVSYVLNVFPILKNNSFGLTPVLTCTQSHCNNALRLITFACASAIR